MKYIIATIIAAAALSGCAAQAPAAPEVKQAPAPSIFGEAQVIPGQGSQSFPELFGPAVAAPADSQTFLEQWQQSLLSPPAPKREPRTWVELMLPGYDEKGHHHG